MGYHAECVVAAVEDESTSRRLEACAYPFLNVSGGPMTWRGRGRLGGQREEGVLQEDHQADGDGDDPLGWNEANGCPSGEGATVKKNSQIEAEAEGGEKVRV